MFLVIVGLILYFIGAITLLIAEFEEGILWGLAGLITQISHLIFAVLHFDKCKKPLIYIISGILFVILGCLFQR